MTRLLVTMITDGNIRCVVFYWGQVELGYGWDEFVVILEGQVSEKDIRVADARNVQALIPF